MTDEVKLTTPEDFAEAVGVLAKGQIELETRVTALTQLVQGMDARIKLLTALLDSHHDVLERHRMVPPRPKGHINVN
jgi:hypothetical protein